VLVNPAVREFSMSFNETIIVRRTLAIDQFSTPKPSLCHVAPYSFVLWIVRELGH
jgi:hypothetical protein